MLLDETASPSRAFQVTLCDPIWHVSSSSGVATSVSELLYPRYFTYFIFQQDSTLVHGARNSSTAAAQKLSSETVNPELKPTDYKI